MLARELAEMKLLGGFDGLTVPELVRAAMAYRADCDPESEEFLDGVVAERPNELPLWQLKQLVAVCRHVAGVSLAPLTSAWKQKRSQTKQRPHPRRRGSLNGFLRAKDANRQPHKRRRGNLWRSMVDHAGLKCKVMPRSPGAL